MFEDLEPEFNEPNTVICASFLFEHDMYTISTVKLSGASNFAFCNLMTTLGDALYDNTDLTGKDYETLLFIDGEPASHPFGDMFGNEMQGIFQRYSTEDEAKQGHLQFVEKVKQVLTDRVKEERGVQ